MPKNSEPLPERGLCCPGMVEKQESRLLQQHPTYCRTENGPDDIFDLVECEYLVCLLDGIFVPFFIEEYRFRSDTTALVKLEGVDTSEKARMFTNVEVYFPKKYVGEEEDSDDIPTWNYFIGFKVEDVNHGELGEIVAVDDSTMNVLFAIEKDGEELLLPAHEEFITKLDKKKRLLTVEVPDGLI